MDCNAELSAKVLRWKSHYEKCPSKGQNSIFFFSADKTLNLYKYLNSSQKLPLEFSIDHSDSYWPVLTTFWHIDRGGFNRLKPLVKTRGGFYRPTLMRRLIWYFNRHTCRLVGRQLILQFLCFRIRSGTKTCNLTGRTYQHGPCKMRFLPQ